MCCIFTCCGWMIDLIQRLWTFTMSCCISSAVCCALVTASMSGIALGYNYSLAEYIDLKETNVSVYLKRGIFDDEIGDDMDWRRSGHMPVAGHIGESNLRTGEPEDESSSVRSGRRLDDSIYESDDRNRFEGSLMKLTAKAPAPSPSTESGTSVDMDQLLAKYSMGSVDQMKAIQTLINMRKSADSRHRIVKGDTKPTEKFMDERYLPHMPIYPGDNAPGRRVMPKNGPGVYTDIPSDSARLAVPGEPINDPNKWILPKLPPEAFTRGKFGEYEERPTYPAPVTPRAGPVRPTRPKPTGRPKPSLTTAPKTIMDRREPESSYPKSIDEEMDSFKEKLLLDKFDDPSFKEEEFIKNIKGPRREDEDYEDAARGVPIRKKRESVDSTSNTNGNLKYNSSTNNTKHWNFKDHKRNKTNNYFLYNIQYFSINLLSKDNNITFNDEFRTPNEQENNITTIAPRVSISSSNIVLRLLNLSTTTI